MAGILTKGLKTYIFNYKDFLEKIDKSSGDERQELLTKRRVYNRRIRERMKKKLKELESSLAFELRLLENWEESKEFDDLIREVKARLSNVSALERVNIKKRGKLKEGQKATLLYNCVCGRKGELEVFEQEIVTRIPVKNLEGEFEIKTRKGMFGVPKVVGVPDTQSILRFLTPARYVQWVDERVEKGKFDYLEKIANSLEDTVAYIRSKLEEKHS